MSLLLPRNYIFVYREVDYKLNPMKVMGRFNKELVGTIVEVICHKGVE